MMLLRSKKTAEAKDGSGPHKAAIEERWLGTCAGVFHLGAVKT